MKKGLCPMLTVVANLDILPMHSCWLATDNPNHNRENRTEAGYGAARKSTAHLSRPDPPSSRN